MSRTLELAEPVYDALLQAAEASGITPADWIAARLVSRETPSSEGMEVDQGPKTLLDRFAGRIGVVSSGGQERLSENCGEKFTDYLEAKRRAGHL